MIKASEIADAISAMDMAISFIMNEETISQSRRHVANRLIAARLKLEWSLEEVKIELKNDLKRKEDFE